MRTRRTRIVRVESYTWLFGYHIVYLLGEWCFVVLLLFLLLIINENIMKTTKCRIMKTLLFAYSSVCVCVCVSLFTNLTFCMMDEVGHLWVQTWYVAIKREIVCNRSLLSVFSLSSSFSNFSPYYLPTYLLACLHTHIHIHAACAAGV